MKIIQFNKYKNVQRDYDTIYEILNIAKENNIEVALCLKTEDVKRIFEEKDLVDKYKTYVVSTNEDIIDNLNYINYVDLSDEK